LGGTLEEVMSHWADSCHAQGGTVILPHHPIPNGEQAILAATGRADAIELGEHRDYYRYLNAGYRLPVVGGTDKLGTDVPVGLFRTYVHIPTEDEFTYESWCAGIKAGRTFVSTGPMIELTVDGASIGDTLSLPVGGGTVELVATAESILPFHTLEVVEKGRVVASTESAKGTRRLQLKTTLPLRGHTWLAARCGGPNYQCMPSHHWLPTYRDRRHLNYAPHYDFYTSSR
jgi:hypothetical protein